MVELELKLPMELHEKVETYAESKGITPANAVTEIVSKLVGDYEDTGVSLMLLAKMWDKGFSSYEKIDQAVNMLVNNYHSGMELTECVNSTYALLDDAEPELPYNPFTLKMDYIKLMAILDNQDFVGEENLEMLRYIKNSYPDSPVFTMSYAYIYGFINGKRAERAKKRATN